MNDFSYDQIAEVYATDMGSNMPFDDIGYYLARCREEGGPALELGCGSGRILSTDARDFKAYPLETGDPSPICCCGNDPAVGATRTVCQRFPAHAAVRSLVHGRGQEGEPRVHVDRPA